MPFRPRPSRVVCVRGRGRSDRQGGGTADVGHAPRGNAENLGESRSSWACDEARGRGRRGGTDRRQPGPPGRRSDPGPRESSARSRLRGQNVKKGDVSPSSTALTSAPPGSTRTTASANCRRPGRRPPGRTRSPKCRPVDSRASRTHPRHEPENKDAEHEPTAAAMEKEAELDARRSTPTDAWGPPGDSCRAVRQIRHRPSREREDRAASTGVRSSASTRRSSPSTTRRRRRAKLEAVLEQAEFDATQQKLIADQQVKLAEAERD